MPTENRSSNTEMVSVPREIIEQAEKLLQEDNRCTMAREFRTILAKPAEQHQGEPVAEILVEFFEQGPMAGIKWFTPSAFEHGATKLYTRPAQGEPVALPARKRETGDAEYDERNGPSIEAWNACLDEIAKLGPLYTHADPVCAHEWTDDGEFNLTCTKCGKQENHEPYGWVQTRGPSINQFTQEWDVVEDWEEQGIEYKAMHDHPATADPGEVERLTRKCQNADLALKVQTQKCETLRADVETMRRKNNEYWHETEGLRAQLAERNALLRECRGYVDCDEPLSKGHRDGLLERIDAALSASTEPSAPKCDTCHDQGEIHTGKMIDQGYWQPPEPDMEPCPRCQDEPSAPSPHPINMKTMMQAYEQVDHKALLHGTSNWCASMATALRGVIHSEPSAQKDWCSTMERPKSQCGCPDCGSSIVQMGEPSAPVERDEHQEFEQACREAATARGRELDPEAIRRRADGSHVNPLTECGWWGWQARAALERKQS